MCRMCFIFGILSLKISEAMKDVVMVPTFVLFAGNFIN